MNINNSEIQSEKILENSSSATTAATRRKFINKRSLAFLIKILVAVSVLVLLVLRVKIAAILAAFSQARIWLIFLSFLLLIPNLYFQFYKWRFLVRLIKPEASNSECAQSLFAGFTFGFITPGRFGEFGRAFFIKDCSWLRVLGIAAIDKLFSLSMVILFGSIGLLYFIGREFSLIVVVPLTILIVIALLVVFYILFHPEVIRTFLYSINIILPFRDKIKQLMSSMEHFSRERAIKLIWLNLGFYLVFLFQFYFIILAFEKAAIIQAFLAISATMLVKSMLPISLGDLGIRESAAIFFLGNLGLQQSTGFNSSILLFAINLLIPSIIGLIILLRNRLILINGTNKD